MRRRPAAYLIAVAIFLIACGGSAGHATPTATPIRLSPLPHPPSPAAARQTPPPSTQTTPRPAPTATPTPVTLAATALTDLPVRIGADDDAYILGTLAAGTHVTVVGRHAPSGGKHSWIAIQGMGYVIDDPASIQIRGPADHLEDDPAYYGTQSPVQPPGTRTGSAPIDHLIDLVESGDGAGLAAQAMATLHPCIAEADVERVGPVCHDGIAHGTPSPGFLETGCEGNYEPLDRAQRDLQSLPSTDAQLFAVSAPTPGGGANSGASYFLVFEKALVTGHPGLFAMNATADGHVVTLFSSCGSLPYFTRPPFLIAPVRPAALQP